MRIGQENSWIRLAQFSGQKWVGVDIQNETLADNLEACVWEPMIVKRNAVTAAAEAACLILSVDQTIKSPKGSAGDDGAAAAGAMGMM